MSTNDGADKAEIVRLGERALARLSNQLAVRGLEDLGRLENLTRFRTIWAQKMEWIRGRLRKQLESDDPQKRIDAHFMSLCSRFDKKLSVETVIACLHDHGKVIFGSFSSTVREMAIVDWNYEDTRVVDELIPCLKDQDGKFRAKVAKSLGKKADMRAVQPLIACLKDQDSLVRGNAALSLGMLMDSRAKQPLIENLNDTDLIARYTTIAGLVTLTEGRYFDHFLAGLKDKDQYVRSCAKWALCAWEDVRALEPLIDCANEAGNDDKNLRHALETFIDKRHAVQAMNMYHCKQCIDSLGKLGDSRAVETLIRCMNNYNDEIRASAAKALGTLKDARAVEPLIFCLKDKNHEIRFSAAMALGLLKDVRAAEPLAACLTDLDMDVRSAAAASLCRLKDSRGFEQTLAALQSGNQSTNPAEALEKLGDSRAMAALLACFEGHDNLLVCIECAKALERNMKTLFQ